jgi:hypothetical protein
MGSRLERVAPRLDPVRGASPNHTTARTAEDRQSSRTTSASPSVTASGPSPPPAATSSRTALRIEAVSLVSGMTRLAYEAS